MSKNYKVAHNVISCPLRLTRIAQFVVLSFISVQVAFAENDEVQFNSDFYAQRLMLATILRETRFRRDNIMSICM